MFRIACAVLSIAPYALSVPAALGAENFPQKPIRLLIPFSPGGTTDILARAVQDKLDRAFGVPVIVDNRPGAGGTTGATLVAKSAPDGYTLLSTSASFTFSPSIYKKLGYDAIKDFRHISNLASSPLILGVHPSMPVKTVKQLIALARNRPGEINYSSAGVGSNIHLTTELLKYMAKFNVTQVPYKSGGQATTALISGEVHMTITGLSSAIPFIQSGQMRALAVTTKQRAKALPDIPTIDEAGVPGYDKGGWTGLYAPAGVPDAVIQLIYQKFSAAIRDPDSVKRLDDLGIFVICNPPAEFEKFVRAEIAEWAELIRQMKL